MTKELTTAEIADFIKAGANQVMTRPLTPLEESLIEYTVVQMKYEFWK